MKRVILFEREDKDPLYFAVKQTESIRALQMTLYKFLGEHSEAPTALHFLAGQNLIFPVDVTNENYQVVWRLHQSDRVSVFSTTCEVQIHRKPAEDLKDLWP